MQNTGAFLTHCKKFSKKLPAEILESNGYLITIFESNENISIHMLAEKYDTDIDHHLDEIRFHRSRVNLINKVTAADVSSTVRLRSDGELKIHIPFREETASVNQQNGIYEIRLPENTAYAILELKK